MTKCLTGTIAALAAVFLGLAGCASQKEPAEQALAPIEKTFEESGAEIKKYLPERYAEVSARVEALRAAMANEDYGDVVSEAGPVRDALKRAIAESRIRRAQVRVEMESEWDGLSKTMPGMVAAMDKKISAQRGRPPKGMTREAWKETVASYDAARDAWTKAEADMSKTYANIETAVPSALDAKTKIAELMESLGVKAT
jgi:multidrug efflux pump subunit AcrA (membrane-fusion protein)